MNERLGIVDEAQRKTLLYSTQSDSLRRKILGEAAPTTVVEAQPSGDPEKTPYHLRMPKKSGYWKRANKESRARRRAYETLDDLDVSPLQIVTAVSRLTHVPIGDLCGKCQKKRTCRPRQLAIYFITRYCRDLSLAQIAYIFDRHHTTVLYAMVAVRQRLGKNHEWTRYMVAKVEALLRAPA
jgi:hypothetical protein